MKIQNINNQQSFNANIKVFSSKRAGTKLIKEMIADLTTNPEQDNAIIDALVDSRPRYQVIDEVDTERTWSLQNALEVITGIELKVGKSKKFLAIGGFKNVDFCLRFGYSGKNEGDIVYSISGENFAKKLEQTFKQESTDTFETRA